MIAYAFTTKMTEEERERELKEAAKRSATLQSWIKTASRPAVREAFDNVKQPSYIIHLMRSWPILSEAFSLNWSRVITH